MEQAEAAASHRLAMAEAAAAAAREVASHEAAVAATDAAAARDVAFAAWYSPYQFEPNIPFKRGKRSIDLNLTSCRSEPDLPFHQSAAPIPSK